MELTQELLDQFVGGQLDFTLNGTTFRGEVESVKIDGSHEASRHLKVTFTQLARLAGHDDWVKAQNKPLKVGLMLYTAVDAGTCVRLSSRHIDASTIYLLPPGGHTVDLSDVRDPAYN